MSLSLPLFITFFEKEGKEKSKNCNFKKVLKNNYLKTMTVVRQNIFNATNCVKRHVGDKHIANQFRYKFKVLFNSVRTSDNKLNELQKSINDIKVSTECNSLPHVDVNDISHCHIISKHDDIERLLVT